MIISLTGFMGCGKSSVGRELSRLLCCPFMDLDDVIEEVSGRTIPEIFATDGEAEFRRMEKDALELVFNTQETRQNANSIHQADTSNDIQSHDISIENSEKNQTQCVLALGGGTVMTKKCAEMVHGKTSCIYLRASVDTLLAHLAGEAEGRPMLSGGCHSERPEGGEESALRSRIEDLMARRSATYEKTAHVIIDTDGKSIETIVQEISDYFNK